MNLSSVIVGAATAAIINGATALTALLSQEGVTELSEVSQAALIVVGLGVIISFFKDFQANWFRKQVNKLTGDSE